MSRASLRLALLCTVALAGSAACANVVGEPVSTTSSSGTGGQATTSTTTTSSTGGHGGMPATTSSTGGHGGEGGGMPAACEVSSQCIIDNPCLVGTCGSDQICVFTNLPDGPAPASAQTPGNCMQVVCAAGVPMSDDDATNLPTSTDDCKTPGCNAGMPFLNPKTDGTPCMAMTPTGEVAGECMDAQCVVQCDAMNPCPSKGPCQTASCDASTGSCVYTNLPDGTPTPGATQPVGTCQDDVCVQGQPSMQEDDTNRPVTANDCVTPTCTMGVPSTPPRAQDTVCATLNGNMTGVCDGGGHCVECVANAQCSGATPVCNMTTNMCVQ